MVIPRLVVAFPLISMDYIGTFVLLWNFFRMPHGLEELGQSLCQDRATRLAYFCRDGVWSWCFATGELLDSFSDFFLSGKIL